MDNLKKGDIFGDQSALNEEPSHLTIEVVSKTCQVLKINRSQFFEFFGGHDGEPAIQLRANILLKKIWLNTKLQFLEGMNQSLIEKLNYRNDKMFNKLKPTCVLKKEVPFLKNNKIQNIKPAVTKTDEKAQQHKNMIDELK